MPEIVQTYFEWPTLPATVLLIVVTAYWLMVIVGAVDIDLLDFNIHLDVGLDGHESMLDWGMVGLRWFNIGDVPFMIWLSAFTLPAWLMSAIVDKGMVDPTMGEVAAACLRNFGVGLFAAKLLTAPLKGKLKHTEPNPVGEMIGRRVVITNSEATAAFGQAQYVTGDGAPLQLHVRSADEPIPKGAAAEIVDYSPEKRLYYVRSIDKP